MTHSTYNITQEVTVALGSVTCITKTAGTAAITTEKTVTMTKGTPAASGGKAAVQIGGTKAGDIDITDWWDGGYNAGKPDEIVFVSTSGANVVVRATSKDGNASKVSTLAATDAYNNGWNACLAACQAVNDAYHAGTSTTWSDSGTKTCSEGHSVSWSTSHTYTPQGSSYSGLYTIPAAK